MALIVCPECGEKVSDKSAVCIHCGYPLQDENKGYRYPCIVNGTKYELDWLLDMINKYDNNELEEIKDAAENLKNPVQQIRMQYLAELFQTQHGREIGNHKNKIIREIQEKLNLSQEASHEFLYQILDNDCIFPLEFHGISNTEWSEKHKRASVHCKYCGSTNVKKLKDNFFNLGNQWHCNNCDSDF